jgi:hypothetical protein
MLRTEGARLAEVEEGSGQLSRVFPPALDMEKTTGRFEFEDSLYTYMPATPRVILFRAFGARLNPATQ